MSCWGAVRPRTTKVKEGPSATPREGAIVGTDGADSLIGTIGDDVTWGLGGSDVIAAADGADVGEGGAGEDRINGGDGDDILDGGAGNDVSHAGAGDEADDVEFRIALEETPLFGDTMHFLTFVREDPNTTFDVEGLRLIRLEDGETAVIAGADAAGVVLAEVQITSADLAADGTAALSDFEDISAFYVETTPTGEAYDFHVDDILVVCGDPLAQPRFAGAACPSPRRTRWR